MTSKSSFYSDSASIGSALAGAYLLAGNNLSDLINAATARTNLGLAAIAASGSAADLTGNLALARFNGGTGASSTTFWAGDGTWKTVAAGVSSVFGRTGAVVAVSGDYSFSLISGVAAVAQLPVMVASGASHAAGAAPDPGVTAGSTKFLREDATWAVPAGGSTLPLVGNGATITVSTPLLDLSQTWNAGAVVFTGTRLNVTNTASANGSKLLDLQVGGVSKFGFGIVQSGSQYLLSLTGGFTSGDIALRGLNSAVEAVVGDGSNYVTLHGLDLRATGDIYALTNTSRLLFGSSFDLILTRDGAGLLSQRNGVNAQQWRIYNTFTDVNNGEWLEANWAANALYLRTQNNGTGVLRPINMSADGINFNSPNGSPYPFTVTGIQIAQIASDGVQPGTGQSGVPTLGRTALRWASLFAGGNTVTASTPILDLTQTWNLGTTVFTALKLNVTNTLSAAGSLLADFQLGGVSQLNFTREGRIRAVQGYAGTSGTHQIGDASGGIEFSSGNAYFNNGGAIRAAITSNNGIIVDGTIVGIGFRGGAADAGANDAQLFRQAAGVVGLHNGTLTAGAVFQVYNTSDVGPGAPTNYERGIFDWTSTANVLTIGTQAGGTGTLRDVRIIAGNGQQIYLLTGTNYYDANGAGGLFHNFRDGGGNQLVGIVGSATAGGGYLNWGGQARVTADFSVTSSVALVNVTGLSVHVTAGRTYAFEATLYVTDAAAGGVQAAIAGTATATAIQYTGYTIADNAIKAKTNATALATAVGSTVTTETAGIIVKITGTITVNAAGTLTVQMAQNTSNATATIAKRGSTFIVHDIA